MACFCLSPASIQWLHRLNRWHQPDSRATGVAWKAKLWNGPNEGTLNSSFFPSGRSGTGSRDSKKGPHKNGRNEHKISEGHSGGRWLIAFSVFTSWMTFQGCSINLSPCPSLVTGTFLKIIIRNVILAMHFFSKIQRVYLLTL